jgi:hypothetical protein
MDPKDIGIPIKTDDNINQGVNECLTNNPLNKIDKNIYTVIKSVCKIEHSNEHSKDQGSGFLIKFKKNKKDFYCLMTNEHVVDQEKIKNKEKITIYYDCEIEKREIILDKNKRYINEYTDNNLDITIIQILKEDNINKKYFLLPNNNINNYINKNIYIVQYPNNELSYSKGKIININNNEITHDVSTEYGSSGSPIIIENTKEVIGIHKKRDENIKLNYGDLINYIIKDLEEKKIIKYNDGTYYEGNIIKLKNGYGRLYYNNGNKKYEGNFKNDKFEGKGTYYYENGKIKYDGEWVNDKFEGNGKEYYENGKYYIGEFKLGLKNGKGIQYYKDGNIEYEGYWINNEFQQIKKNIM